MQIITWFQVENKIFLVYVVFHAGYVFLDIGTYSFIFKVYRNQRIHRLSNIRILCIIICGEYHSLFHIGICSSIYYFVMVLLTIDRFLVFHLKFRYNFYFSPSKILKLIIAVASVSFLNSTILAILTSMQIITWFKVENKIFLVYVVFDAAYTFLVIGTYSFILKVYRNQRKFNKATKSTNKKDSFKVLVTTLIIRTFMMYNFIPGTNLCLSMKL